MEKTQPHPGHENHLCDMVEREVPMDKLKPLVKNAKYICICCGRGAAKKENLCAPEPLYASLFSLFLSFLLCRKVF